MTEVAKKKPQFRNIHVLDIARYRLPVAGVLSILHRISGAFLFFFLPFLLYLLDKSLTSEYSFDEYFKPFLAHALVKMALALLAWAYLHHFCAGIRYLLLDIHVGVAKDDARRSSILVFAISLPLALAVALKLFGVF